MVAAAAQKFVVPKRQFVPAQFDPADWAQIQPLADQLMSLKISSAEELKRFLLDFSELTSVIDEYGSRKHIDKSCHTEDAGIERAFLHFIENIEPRVKPVADKLQRKFLEEIPELEKIRRRIDALTHRFELLQRRGQPRARHGL